MDLRPVILTLVAAVCCLAGGQQAAALTEVDDRDTPSLEASACRAFHDYLEAVDACAIDDACEQVLDPGDTEGRSELTERLFDFMRGRESTPVRNEAVIVRTAGDWAMVVYQYDTTVAGKTARVITTAWMIQWEGFWRQFIVAPRDGVFWDGRRTDYELLQQWFDDNAEALIAAA